MSSPARVSGYGRQHCPCQCHPDFSWIRFGDTRIAVSDVDLMFVAERHGHFLYFEWKENDEELTAGQRILLEQKSLVARHKVFVLRGTRGNPEKIIEINKGVWCWPEATSKIDFQSRVDAWFAKANAS